DQASEDDIDAAFSSKEPALASYVASNIDDGNVRKLLAHIGLALSAA
ncbi:MAG: hypothetical protein JRH11_26765, partial [Deltaproteobacteria bacterium]|nr:hypothetical protein [Deltaproteobacteria bacterium]